MPKNMTRFVSKELADVIKVDHSKAHEWGTILRKIHHYIKTHHLHDKEDGRYILPSKASAEFRHIFGDKRFSQMHIAEKVLKHSKACPG